MIKMENLANKTHLDLMDNLEKMVKIENLAHKGQIDQRR